MKAEGVVFKNYNKQLFAKYVRDAFKEKNAETFGHHYKYHLEEDNDNARIVYVYATNARIDKMIFKLLDEGHELEIKLMEKLPKRLYADIMEEHWQDIVFSKWKVDFGKLKKSITKRCLAVLKRVITNNAILSEVE